jgi:hypothetical protein
MTEGSGMLLSQLLFFFIVLPVIYTMLAIILLAAIGSTIRQIKYTEYEARAQYDLAKLKMGEPAVERIRHDLAEVK